MLEYRRKSKKGRLTIVRRRDDLAAVKYLTYRSFVPHDIFDPKLRPAQRKWRAEANNVFIWGPLAGSASAGLALHLLRKR